MLGHIFLNLSTYYFQYGASLQIKDREGLVPLDIVMKDKLAHVDYNTGKWSVGGFRLRNIDGFN